MRIRDEDEDEENDGDMQRSEMFAALGYDACVLDIKKWNSFCSSVLERAATLADSAILASGKVSRSVAPMFSGDGDRDAPGVRARSIGLEDFGLVAISDDFPPQALRMVGRG